jgi:hypothetical protein
MTSTPVTLLEFRTGQSSDRPFPQSFTQGQLAISFGASDPGLYFLDSSSNVQKIGGAHYGGTAPNSNPQGQPGNSPGELWADTTANHFLRVWTGSAWEEVGAGFVTQADTANFATTAGTANFATTADTANFAITASGADFATRAGTADKCLGQIATIFVGQLPNVGPAGSAAFNTASGYLYISTGSAWQQVIS